MEIAKGKCLTLKQIDSGSFSEREGRPVTTIFEVVEDYFMGEGGTSPQAPGRYIQVTVDRNFRVVPVREFQVEELD